MLSSAFNSNQIGLRDTKEKVMPNMNSDFLKKLPPPSKLACNMNQITPSSRRDSKKLKRSLKKVIKLALDCDLSC